MEPKPSIIRYCSFDRICNPMYKVSLFNLRKIHWVGLAFLVISFFGSDKRLQASCGDYLQHKSKDHVQKQLDSKGGPTGDESPGSACRNGRCRANPITPVAPNEPIRMIFGRSQFVASHHEDLELEAGTGRFGLAMNESKPIEPFLELAVPPPRPF
jgi:hypothetical protein